MDINPYFCIRRLSLTTEWQPLLAAIDCSAVIVSADVAWEYCSDTSLTEAKSEVSAGIKETIPDCNPTFRVPFPGPHIRFSQGQGICYVKAKTTAGFIQVHYIR